MRDPGNEVGLRMEKINTDYECQNTPLGVVFSILLSVFGNMRQTLSFVFDILRNL